MSAKMLMVISFSFLSLCAMEEQINNEKLQVFTIPGFNGFGCSDRYVKKLLGNDINYTSKNPVICT